MLALLLSLLASASPTQVRWDLTVNDKVVGQRTLTVREESVGDLQLRTLQSETSVDARVLGIPFAFDQKLTANVDIGPASFISVVRQGDDLTQVQGRRAALGWMLTVTADGRTRSDDLDADDVDLSTADLLDPDSRVPLSRFTEARILSAETGEVLSGRVEPLGPDEVTIGGTAVPVEGYRWTGDRGAGTFWYTSEGWLVRFESTVLGQRLAGTLAEPPPLGPDDQPVPVFGPALQSTEL